MNDHQEKALEEGCHEENRLDRLSPTEKTNTKKNLARATTKSKSKTQQSLMDVSVKG